MPSMSYCRHENTLADLATIWDEWDDWNPAESNEYEIRARKELMALIVDMADSAAQYLDEIGE